MIKIIKGDVTEAKESVIIHQVNCQGKMGSGVAKAIKEKFPEAYNVYIKDVNFNDWSGKPKTELLGKYNLAFVHNREKKIINCFNQLYYGYDGKLYTDYKAFFNTFLEVLKNNDCDIAMPYKMGCDRGGADWDGVIYPFIEACSKSFKNDIVIYRLD